MAQHNFRLGANYVSGVDDERGPTTPGGYFPGTSTCTTVIVGAACPAGVPFIATTWGIKGKDWLSFDFTYLFELTETMRLTATVSNITDKDPPQSRQELGYDPRIGNPLGRTFEIGLKKTF